MKNFRLDLLQVNLKNTSLNRIEISLRQRIRGAIYFLSKDHVLSLADQAVVSTAGFLTTVLIARWSGSIQLGFYAVVMSLLFSLVTCQDSLIMEPYLIQRYYPQGTPAERAGASLVLSALYSVASTCALAIAALAFYVSGGGAEMVMMIWAIAGVAPFALLRNFARRFWFARSEFVSALVLDTAIAVFQLTWLGWLAATGRMSALCACVAVGGTYAIAAMGWLYYVRREFVIRMTYVRIVLKQTWALGKWLLAGQITAQLPGNLIYWLLLTSLGAVATGVFAACMSIVGFVNPLLQGLRNSVMPQLVLAWKNGSEPGLWQAAIHNTKVIAALTAPISLAVAVAGEPIMRVLYRGNEFAGHGHELTVLALSGFCASLGIPASIALATMERPRAIVAITTTAAGVTLALAWIFMQEWGLLGVIYGLLGGSLFGTVGRWLALFTRVAKSCAPASDSTAAMRAVQEVTKCAADGLAITRLGVGDHAETFLIQSKNPKLFPNEDALAVKVYKAEAVLTLAMARAQFKSLLRLHEVLDGRNINGWRISVPNPLHLCESPLALVMTAARGRQIEYYASRCDSSISKTLIDAARTCALAMQQCWAIGQRHGDLWLANILLDLENKEISFIDAGTIEACSICNDGTNVRTAREIAHLLCQDATDISGLFGRSAVRTAKEAFVEHFLLATIENVDVPEERQVILNEIWFWAKRHLQPYLGTSWSIQVIWFRFVYQVATYRIRWLLKRLETQSKVQVEQDVSELEVAVQSTQPVVS
jgi:O-antigen/teichoic acid export membrane protein